MGCTDYIDYTKYPKQTNLIGEKVKVCYHYDSSRHHFGTIIRDDKELPFNTVIQLDNGRVLLAIECQYSFLK